MYGSHRQAQAEEDAAKRKAALQRLQAKETLRRFELERSELEKSAQNFMSSQKSAISAAGGATGKFIQLEATAKKASQEIENLSLEAEFKANQIRRGADFTEDMGRAAGKAGFLEVLGIGLGAASSYMKNAPGKTSGGGFSGSGS
jgi:hypothetical protein